MGDLHVLLGGQPWTIRWVTRRQMPRRTWGDCDSETRTIRVRRDLSIPHQVDTLLHECRHAQQPELSEEFVDSSSTELAMVLVLAGMVMCER